MARLADFYQEVEDDVRAQRAQALARRLAPFAAAVVILLLAAVGVWQFLKSRADRRAEAASAQYFAAAKLADQSTPGGILDTQAATRARDAFVAVAAGAPHGLAVLSKLRIAGLDASLGERDAAHKLWNDIATDTAAPEAQRSLATLLDVQARIGIDPAAALKSRLVSLEAPGAPWRAMAQESEAMVDLQAGDQGAARSVLESIIASGDAPLGARQRAQGLLQTLPPAASPAGAASSKTPVAGASAPKPDSTHQH